MIYCAICGEVVHFGLESFGQKLLVPEGMKPVCGECVGKYMDPGKIAVEMGNHELKIISHGGSEKVQ